MKDEIKLLSWMAGMFFKTLVSIATLYILSTTTESFSKISPLSGILSIIWILDIPFIMEIFSKKKKEKKNE